MAAFRLIPREEKFFADFQAMAEQLRNGAVLLEEMLSSSPSDPTMPDTIKELEHHCDFLTHETIQRLNRTFVTPIDREDIHKLALVLDDVMDAIEAVAALFPLYRIGALRYGAVELARLITLQTEQIVSATALLEKRKGVLDRVREIDRLEHEADEIYKKAVGQLFDDEPDPIVVIKWKEILYQLEKATDNCEDVGNVLENIVVKHG